MQPPPTTPPPLMSVVFVGCEHMHVPLLSSELSKCTHVLSLASESTLRCRWVACRIAAGLAASLNYKLNSAKNCDYIGFNRHHFTLAMFLFDQ